MSKKYKRHQSSSSRLSNKTPAPVSTPSKDSGLSKLISMLGLDGYSNAAAFLGEDSPLISSGTFKRSYLTMNTELLTTMYRENWLAMRIIDMPCEDMTRAWYKVSCNMDEDDLNQLRRLEAKHNIKQEITSAIRWSRLYGGAIAVIAIDGQENMMDQPLDMNSIAPGDFKGLLILDRAQGITPSVELVSDLDDPDFGLPMYYSVSLEAMESRIVMIHHSRVLRFIGRELPYLETVNESYWGASELEHVYDELQKRAATSANIAQLVFQANVTTLKMGDFGEALALGTEEQKQNIIAAIANENRFRTSYGLQLLSADDTMENHQYTFTGLSDVYEQFMMDVCGAAEIPATKLFGRSPSGLNSTGEADLRNYYEKIAQMQESGLRPALEKLVPVMALSCWGFVPDDLQIVFEPIAAITPKEKAELISKVSDPIIRAFQVGLISREEAVRELKAAGEEYGVWDKLQDPDADAPATFADPSADPDAGPQDVEDPYRHPDIPEHKDGNEIVSSADIHA